MAKLRVGITYDRTLIHLRRPLGPGAALDRQAQGGTSWRRSPAARPGPSVPSGKGYAIRDHAGDLVGGKVWGGRADDLFATYADTGARVFVKEADAVSGVGYAYNRGYLEFNLYRRRRLVAGTGDRADRDRAVPAGDRRDAEFLAGAGAGDPGRGRSDVRDLQARNYGLRAYCNCDITDGANDQVYIGYNKEGGTDGKRWVHAVNATTRQIVTTQQGKVIQAFFAASDGGHSDAVEDVWHSGNPAYAVSYLKAECDPGEYTAGQPVDRLEAAAHRRRTHEPALARTRAASAR